MEVTKQDDAWHSDGLGAARIGGHPPVVRLARFSFRVLPKPNDLVEDLGHPGDLLQPAREEPWRSA
jgi:hypothetical protein